MIKDHTKQLDYRGREQFVITHTEPFYPVFVGVENRKNDTELVSALDEFKDEGEGNDGLVRAGAIITANRQMFLATNKGELTSEISRRGHKPLPVHVKKDKPDGENTQNRNVTNGGKSGDTGLKTWQWEDVPIPEYSGQGVSFSNGQFTIDSECNPQVTNEGKRLRFYLDPTNPDPASWCGNDFNMRAEFHTKPWNVRQPLGTEEWFGWSYTFGDDYVIDQKNEFVPFQIHQGVNAEAGGSPQIKFQIINDNDYDPEHLAGELFVINRANEPDNHPTGITPQAGDTLKIVVHVIWADASTGLLQVWINDQIVYDKQVRTVYPSAPWGGNAKWGIYKSSWRNENAVQESLDQGITHLETFMGPLRIITRRPDDPDYKKDSYSEVRP